MNYNKRVRGNLSLIILISLLLLTYQNCTPFSATTPPTSGDFQTTSHDCTTDSQAISENCQSPPPRQDTSAPPPSAPAELPQNLSNPLEYLVPKNLLPYASLEVAGLENLSTGSYLGKNFLGFKIREGETGANGGIRAEASVDFGFVEGERVTYEYYILLPSDFTPDPLNRWWLVTQFHDQPDVTKGETWENFPSHSPTIALAYAQDKGEDRLGLVYGSAALNEAGSFVLPRNIWTHIRISILWSRTQGALELYVNHSENPVLRANGSNMHNSYQHYLKLGTYRHPSITVPSEIRFSELKITK